jgi:hypothetical protein
MECIANECRDELFSIGEGEALASGNVLDEATDLAFRLITAARYWRAS